jgi:hypothetical protein
MATSGAAARITVRCTAASSGPPGCAATGSRPAEGGTAYRYTIAAADPAFFPADYVCDSKGAGARTDGNACGATAARTSEGIESTADDVDVVRRSADSSVANVNS